MKYINQVNAVLVLIGGGAAAYALSETYFNPAAQPRVEVSVPAPVEESGPSERSTPTLPPQWRGSPGSSSSTSSTRPTRTRPRPNTTSREALPVRPSEESARPGGQQYPGTIQRSGSSPTIPPSVPRSRRDRMEDDEELPQSQRPSASPARPTPGGGFRPTPGSQRPPQGQPQPEKRETAPPPPARSSQPW